MKNNITLDIDFYIGIVNEMHDLSEVDDTEENHIQADKLLVKLLKELDLTAIVDAYEKLDKWYS